MTGFDPSNIPSSITSGISTGANGGMEKYFQNSGNYIGAVSVDLSIISDIQIDNSNNIYLLGNWAQTTGSNQSTLKKYSSDLFIFPIA